MSKFTPLEEYLDEAWDDPEKRKELRKALFERIAELEAECKRLRSIIDLIDPGNLSHRIAELEENNKLLRAKVEKYLKLLEELDPDPRNLAKRLK